MNFRSLLIVFKWLGLGAFIGLVWTFLSLIVMSFLFSADSAGNWFGSFNVAKMAWVDTLATSPWTILFFAALGLMIGFYKLKHSRAN